MVKRNSIKRLLHFRSLSFERLSLLLCLTFCFVWILRSRLPQSPIEENLLAHRSKTYDVSNPFIIINLIDQFLDTTDANDRDKLWPILIQSWSNSFQLFLKRNEILCSSTTSSSSFDFLYRHFDQYTKNVLTDNLLIQRYLTGFGLFFDYDPRQMRMKNHHQTFEIQLSECLYFDLIILLMKIQLVLHQLKIPYFLSRNSLIGAIRHHDITPWASTIGLNLPEKEKSSLIEQIPNQFDLTIDFVNDSSVDKKEMGSFYKIMNRKNSSLYVELFFYSENETDLSFGSMTHVDYVKKTDVYPVHLRPFGPLLVYTMNNPSAIISKENLDVCEIYPSTNQLRKSIERNEQWRMPCERLTGTFEFVRSTKSWRRGFTEETLKTKQRPYKTFSYFRYVSHENQTSLFS